jgi:uncharacterized RDD family membrane protein YckC
MEFVTETDRPYADTGSRLAAYVVDLVISSSVLVTSITIFGLLINVAKNHSNSPLSIVLKVAGSLVVLAGIFFVLWHKWGRVLNHRSTLGMRLLGLEIECAQAGLSGSSNPFLTRNPFLFWVNIGNKKGQKPAGDMDEECMDSQIGKGFLAFGALMVFGMVNLLLYPLAILLSRIIVLIRNLVTGHPAMHMVNAPSIQLQDKVILGIVSIPEIVIFLFIVFGFIFALGADRRSLADYFFGVRIVNSKGLAPESEHRMGAHW